LELHITSDRLAHWLSRLVQIPSVTPNQAGPRAGTPGEARLAAQLAEWFAALGGQVIRDEVLPGRPNIYAIWRGSSERWLAVDTHMDTVGVEQMEGEPFSGCIADGRVYGRGAADTKPTFAVVLALLEAMQQARVTPKANLLIGATIDEEVGAVGAPAFAQYIQTQHIKVDQLIVAEPTLCAPVYGHKGLVRMYFDVHGQAAHSSQPELGSNAIIAAAPMLLALGQEAQRLLNVPAQTALGPGRLTVTLIAGGRGINVVPDECRISIDRRTLPSEGMHDVCAALTRLAEQSCALPVSAHVITLLDAFLQPCDTAWVRSLSEWSGQAPAVAPYCTNAWAYGKSADECIVLGAGNIDQAHGPDEWVEIRELERLASIYSRWWGVAG
jgi:succinyl-diaminopimelate desuccinylase